MPFRSALTHAQTRMGGEPERVTCGPAEMSGSIFTVREGAEWMLDRAAEDLECPLITL
jgi:hypothetical protein